MRDKKDPQAFLDQVGWNGVTNAGFSKVVSKQMIAAQHSSGGVPAGPVAAVANGGKPKGGKQGKGKTGKAGKDNKGGKGKGGGKTAKGQNPGKGAHDNGGKGQVNAEWQKEIDGYRRAISTKDKMITAMKTAAAANAADPWDELNTWDDETRDEYLNSLEECPIFMDQEDLDEANATGENTMLEALKEMHLQSDPLKVAQDFKERANEIVKALGKEKSKNKRAEMIDGAITTYTVRPPAHPSVRPSVRPSIRPSVRPSVRPTVRPSVRPSITEDTERRRVVAQQCVCEGCTMLHLHCRRHSLLLLSRRRGASLLDLLLKRGRRLVSQRLRSAGRQQRQLRRFQRSDLVPLSPPAHPHAPQNPSLHTSLRTFPFSTFKSTRPKYFP